MNIGLIDVDRTKFPNIALGKIADGISAALELIKKGE